MQMYQIEISDTQRSIMGQALITYINEFSGIHDDSDIGRASVLEDFLYDLVGNSSYKFEISETERVLIMQALRAYVREYNDAEEDGVIGEASKLEDCFMEMPEIEQYHPGCNHGLCL
jgi:hypothetical protein